MSPLLTPRNTLKYHILLLIIFGYALISASGDTASSCRFKSPDGKNYDLSTMTKKRGEQDFHYKVVVSEGVDFVYVVNICSDIVSTCEDYEEVNGVPSNDYFDNSFNALRDMENGEGRKGGVAETLMVSFSGAMKDQCSILGKSEGFEIKPFKPMMKKYNPDQEGVQIVYKNGDSCGENMSRTVHLNIECSKHDDHKVIQDVNKENSCLTVIRMKSKHACAISKDVSTLVYILIVTFVSLFLALGLSIVYKYKVDGSRGEELIPSIVKKMPEYVKDGVTSTYNYSYETCARNSDGS